MLCCILLGITAGMRTMTGIAVVCWAAYLGYLPVQGTWAFWTAKLVSALVFTALALGEYVGDTLPRTPSRTDLPLVAGRLSFGILVGIIISTVMGQPWAGGLVFGTIGALIGTYGGYRLRMAFAKRLGRDLPVALTESALALALALFAVWHVHREILDMVAGAVRAGAQGIAS